MNPVDLHAIWSINGKQMVKTGIYVPDSMTIKEIRELMKGYANRGEPVPNMVEFSVKEEEE